MLGGEGVGGTTRAADWIQREKTDAGFIGSISIHSACWLTEVGGGRGSVLYRWMQVVVFHSQPFCSKNRVKKMVQPASSIMQELTCTHPHTRRGKYHYKPMHRLWLTAAWVKRSNTNNWLIETPIKHKDRNCFKNSAHASVKNNCNKKN